MKTWPIPRGEALTLLQQSAGQAGRSEGFYNVNFPSVWSGQRVVVRVPIASAPRMDLIAWPEDRVLACVSQFTELVPRLLFASTKPRFQVHTFLEGDLLDGLLPKRTAIGPAKLERLVAFVAMLSRIPPSSWPETPAGWPQEGDSRGVFRRLCDVTRRVYEEATQTEEHHLLAALGVPHDPFAQVEEGLRKLRSRPFVLAHCDIHRKNLIQQTGRLFVIDWELSLPADPVYELAVHLHKMKYPEVEELAFIDGWTDAIGAHYSVGWRDDLRIYRDHERVKSAIVDAIRYSRRLRVRAGSPERPALVDSLTQKLIEAQEVWGGPATTREAVDALIDASPSQMPSARR